MLRLVGSNSAQNASGRVSRRVINVAACNQSVLDLGNQDAATLAARIQAMLQDYGVFASVKIYDEEGETACYGGVCARKPKGKESGF
jgi:hypothetical protein